jgi:regulator of sirC expression with transglutaminase-like and TPR domain
MQLQALLSQLAQDPATSVDLAEVALLLARDEYPQLDVDAYLSELTGMAHEARDYLGQTLEGQVAGLCRYLFHEMGFRGNQEHYYDPLNSYLNVVLDRRTGIPITLSLITMVIGEKLGVHIDGIGLPGHFVVMARQGGQRILFDPYHGGRLLDPADCEQLVQKSAGLDLTVDSDLLQAALPGQVVLRMITNLKGCYLRDADFQRAVRTICRLIQLVPRDWTQRRDLGSAYLQNGQPGKAIDQLQAYLANMPDAIDREAVEKQVRQARAEVARWN